jgi:predicted phage tail protein
MTELRLHGILAKEFGSSFFYELEGPREAFFAVDANQEGFINRILALHRNNINYTMIVDNEYVKSEEDFFSEKAPKRIDIVPIVAGAGGGLGALIGALVMAVISYILYLLLRPKEPETPRVEATTRAIDESFTFSNKANIAAQGTPVPVGYGQLRVGSQVVQFVSKNFPQDTPSTNAMTRNPYFPGSAQFGSSTYANPQW